MYRCCSYWFNKIFRLPCALQPPENQEKLKPWCSSMAGDEGEPIKANLTVGLKEMVENQCSKIREHAETYTYLWGSYILVYCGLGAYFTFRWRKLRQTENRVRVLHRRLRKHVEAEESASASGYDGTGSFRTASRWWLSSVFDSCALQLKRN